MSFDNYMQRSALLVVLAWGMLLSSARAAQKGAHITLKARWEATPYLLEAAEAMVSASGRKRCTNQHLDPVETSLGNCRVIRPCGP